MTILNKAVFFDKDGVLNADISFEKNYSKEAIYPEASSVISLCKKAGYKTVMVTNQTVISRGILSKNELQKKLVLFQNYLKEFDSSAIFDAVYFCPHHPNASLLEYKVLCECRKPKPGMLLQASRELNIDLSQSFMIGDRVSDITAAHLAGCKSILLKSGMHQKKSIETDLELVEEIIPDYTASNLIELSALLKRILNV